MPDIILTVVSGGTDVELGLSIPGVQGPIGQSTLPSGGTAGQLIVKQSSTNYDAAWTTTISGITLRSSTVSGGTFTGTISGGTLLAPTITGSTLNGCVLNGGNANGTALSSATVDACAIDNSTIEDSTIFNVTLSGTVTNGTTITGGKYSSAALLSPTLSGVVTFSGGVTIAASGSSMGFYGASPVARPSGIAIPSGGSSVAEVLTTVSGLVIALRNLGLIKE